MSNIIKAHYVWLDRSEKKVIDSDSRTDISYPEIIPFEIGQTGSFQAGGFIEGLPIKEECHFPDEEMLKKEEANQMISEARAEAIQIREEAHKEAERYKNQVYEEAKKKGYEEGYQKAVSGLQQKERELEAQMRRQEEEYQKQLEELEPQFAKLCVQLLEKATGIVLNDYQEIVTYLLKEALEGAEKSKHYLIEVSKEDYEYVSSQEEMLRSLVRDSAVFEIVIEPELNKGQCMIELDSCTINCGLDVRLEGLITDLKLLAEI